MTRITIAEAIKEEMEVRGLDFIWVGEPEAIDSQIFPPEIAYAKMAPITI
tara:strand:- start:94285 stop:94434 length:150 start_codon:yes stop_codon:yes gene_type:complete